MIEVFLSGLRQKHEQWHPQSDTHTCDYREGLSHADRVKEETHEHDPDANQDAHRYEHCSDGDGAVS